MGKTIADQGELVGLCGWNGTTWEPVLIDGTKRLVIAIAASALPTGAATSIKQLADGHNVTVDNVSIAVTGAFYQVTQPISAVALPLPALAATAAKQLADGHNVTVDNVSIAVTGAFYQVTQPISAVALPLPALAATAAKQLADGHNVTVDNVSIAVTGAFYQVTQPVSLADQTAKAGVRRLALSQAYYNGVPGDAIWHDLLDVSGPGLLVGLDFVSDHADSRLKITVDGDVIYHPRAMLSDVITAAWFSTLNGSGGESCWMKAGVYDAENNYYSMYLKREVAYYSTLKVEYYAGSVTAKVGISAQYRITE